MEKREFVCHYVFRGCLNQLGTSFKEYTNFFKGLYKNIPKQFRESSDITLDIDSDGTVYAEITYDRPETDTEMELRINNEESRSIRKLQEEKDRVIKFLKDNPEFYSELIIKFCEQEDI
jgi:hypothetical protein